MAETEEKIKTIKKEEKASAVKKEEEKPRVIAKSIVRMLSTDVPGESTIYHGLTKIKGISWSFSSALCAKLGIDRKRKISSLNKTEIEKIIAFIKEPSLPIFLLNRRRDLETGKDKHLVVSDLELQRDFDIKRMKKMRSYKGWRHALGQPVRGQRTRSHFRKGSSIGVQHAKTKPATSTRGKD